MSRLLVSLPAFFALILFGFVVAPKPLQVGEDSQGGYVVATGQRVRPAGKTLAYNGRPVDLTVSPDGKSVYLKDDKGVTVVDAGVWKVRQRLSFPKSGGSMHGIVVSRNGRRVFATNAANELFVGTAADDGTLSWTQTIGLPGKGASYPCGIALSGDERTAFVCLSRSNTLAVVDLDGGKVVKEIAVGVAPYDVVVSDDGKTAFVSDWGGRKAREGEKSADSSGTMVPVDNHGVARVGCVSFVDLAAGKESQQVEVGLHPADILLSRDGKTLFVANANSDSVSVLDTEKQSVLRTISVNPGSGLKMAGTNALALGGDGKTLFVALANRNAVAVVDLSSNRVFGLMPTGFFPGALAISGGNLHVACVKGVGSRGTENASTNGHSVYSVVGTLSRITANFDPAALQKYTAQANLDSREQDAIAALQRVPTFAKGKPVPVPAHIGQPSVFKHCIYIIKENRTYDQVLGDLEQGNGEPKFCLYGRRITPNHHALAERFVLLDNFYCNGVNSADGHSWATEGNNTDHLEKSFGGFTRSYTFGDDALTYSASGFLWDNVLDHGLTFRNYGEMDYTDEKPDVSYTVLLEDWKTKAGKIAFSHKIGVARLKKYSNPDSPGWNMDIPDVVRADVFLKDLTRCERENKFPSLAVVYLPNDHTTGTTPGDPTPNSYLADNDLALGRVVEGISRSRFWKDTCIFVVEDDPQAGVDHVDGHRSPCLLVSPYTRRGVVISNFYNQTSVLHTMARILGLPPMNRMDALSPLMTSCFTTAPNFAPFVSLPNTVPLGQLNERPKTSDTQALYWAKASARLNLRSPDQIQDDTLNRALWFAARKSTLYPARFAGAHGRGLAKLGLQQIPVSDED